MPYCILHLHGNCREETESTGASISLKMMIIAILLDSVYMNVIRILGGTQFNK